MTATQERSIPTDDDPNTVQTGLRRRHVAGDQDTRHNDHDRPSIPPVPRSKGLMDLLFSPLTLILGESEPEDPQVELVSCICKENHDLNM